MIIFTRDSSNIIIKNKIMNEVILKRMIAKLEVRPVEEIDSVKSRAKFKEAMVRKRKLIEEPNLEMNMLRKERMSDKRTDLGSGRYECLEKELLKSSRADHNSRDTISRNKSCPRKQVQQLPSNHSHNQLLVRNSNLSLKRRKLYLYCKNRTKDCSESLNKINTTAPLSINTPKDISKPQSIDRSNWKKIESLCKSQSCKARTSPYLLNPEEILEAFQKGQAKDLSKRLVLKLNRDKDKRIYEEAVTHLFELARLNMMDDKVRAEMPYELDVKEIVIPRKGYREDWLEKVQKYKENAIKNRQQSKSKAAEKERPLYIKSQARARAKTDAKTADRSNRNRTEFKDKNEFWMQLIDKPFEPWQYDSANSRFFE